MKFEKERKVMKVKHSNGHCCGDIVYDNLWDLYQFYPVRCGLDSLDLRDIANTIDKSEGNLIFILNFGDHINRIRFALIRFWNSL